MPLHAFPIALGLLMTSFAALAQSGSRPASGATRPTVASATTSVGRPASTGLSVHPLFGGGLTFGGDSLYDIKDTKGATQQLKAGEAYLFYGGAEWAFDSLLAIRATLGVHHNTEDYSNADFSFTRYPLEITGTYAVIPELRLGGGLALALNGKVTAKGSGLDNPGSHSFKMAPGLVLKSEYLLNEHLSIEGRYVFQTFQFKGGSGEKVNADHLGLLFNVYF